MSATSPVRAPVGPDADRWTTVPFRRTVLAVVHTVASANRLADILPVFESDPRVQLLFTAIGASAISEGVIEELEISGRLTIPWKQAVGTAFDLAIAVNHSGELWRIDAPLLILSHGIGYTKFSHGRRNPPSSALVGEAVYGIAPEWLLHDGLPFVDAIALSHEEQRTRLAAVVPEALPAAVVVGDPCYDRMRASRPLRNRYRRRLGVHPTDTVITISSTWGSDSLFGDWPTLAHELLAELPIDMFRVLLVLHPNIWFAHGRWQLLSWLAEAVRAGLTVIEPHAGWQQAILASDVVIGDHGAVTGYAAALGIPAFLGVGPSPNVVPGTAIAALTDIAPRLDRSRPLLDQISTATPSQFSPVTDLISDAPDRSAQRLRDLCYRLLDLPTPSTDPVVHSYAAEDLPAGRPPIAATLVDGTIRLADNTVHVRLSRLPADVRRHRSAFAPDRDAHLVVLADHPQQALRAAAAIIQGTENADAPDRITALVEDARTCRVSGTQGTIILRYAGPPYPDPSALASVVHLWISHGHAWKDLPSDVSVDLGRGPQTVQVSHEDATEGAGGNVRP